MRCLGGVEAQIARARTDMAPQINQYLLLGVQLCRKLLNLMDSMCA